ncbi:charged multivesicular body protein 3 isoform X2 [Phyllopteryx taeniolatus]|uniref:charged multivesicular body protein 3 isoform X2 n=1 Tax=Phyllopteryx taeniolatus TaxID=161469 RepID=UPI002AD4C4DD|nr:charged multivesicular body protein 3 isoform X2 [Phyllopteryx taeniolatus]
MGLFGRTPEKPPKDLINEWTQKIRKESRTIDRQIRDIQREQEKVKRSIKDAAKKGQRDVCVILAKEMVQSKRAVTKLYSSKAHLNSVSLSMKNQLSLLRVAGSLQKSTEVMKAMQSLVKVPEIQATMRDLSKEMMKVPSAKPPAKSQTPCPRCPPGPPQPQRTSPRKTLKKCSPDWQRLGAKGLFV